LGAGGGGERHGAAQRRARVGHRHGDGVEVGGGGERVARGGRAAGEVGAGRRDAGAEREKAERAPHAAFSARRAASPSWRHSAISVDRAISSAGRAMMIMRTSLRESAHRTRPTCGTPKRTRAWVGWLRRNVHGSATWLASPFVRKIRPPVWSLPIQAIRWVIRWSGPAPAGGR